MQRDLNRAVNTVIKIETAKHIVSIFSIYIYIRTIILYPNNWLANRFNSNVVIMSVDSVTIQWNRERGEECSQNACREKMYKVFRNIVLRIYDDLIMVMEI